jgi:uncharacterized membrane protein YdjX (TVP38/TMEM64 family)
LNKWKVVIIILVVAIIPFFFPSIQKGLTLLMNGEGKEFITWIRSWGVFAPMLSIFLMVLQAIAAPIPSFLIAGANGMVFGVFWGIVISWVGAMLGAIVSFYLAKGFGKTVIPKKQKEKEWVKKLDQISGKHGLLIVLIARLIPVVSFDFISYAAGLTRIKVSHFLLGTGIGMLPATIIYTIIGHDFLQLEDYKGRIIILFLLLAVLFLAGLWVRKRYVTKNE